MGSSKPRSVLHHEEVVKKQLNFWHLVNKEHPIQAETIVEDNDDVAQILNLMAITSVLDMLGSNSKRSPYSINKQKNLKKN